MSPPRLIVCEKSGRWAVAFRRALTDEVQRISEVRSIFGCESMLEEHRTSIVAVEVTTANLDGVIAAIPSWLRRFPHCRVLALTEAELASAETLLREAGAVAVLKSTRDASAAARLVERHFAAAPEIDLPLAQAIAAGLPWAKWASTAD
ncbi:MAG: hypothetical protein L0211_24210 [Planctomycetaceae bacterium]|nr:hypothetical protein [Planctomycetaceae bacterium]